MSLQRKEKLRIYTYSDYASWPEDERLEIINGKLFMQAAPSRICQEVLMELSRQIANYLADRRFRVYPAPFCVRLPEGDEKDEDIKTVVEPDITVVCDLSKLDEKGITKTNFLSKNKKKAGDIYVRRNYLLRRCGLHRGQ
ncbi:MAG: hypothetical protein PWQ97_1551 [Tepidanaerobacteraceae bacterium]|nr:hypothetical protein [Tepidanaerobacteraceae bacterium]